MKGATVTATNSKTGEQTFRVTTESGAFELPLLEPGDYTITVNMTGFQLIKQEHVIVEALAKVPLNPKLQLGATTESINVSAEATILQAADEKLGSTMGNAGL